MTRAARTHAPSREGAPASIVVRIDRLVIDAPTVGPGDAVRFEAALSAEFRRLAESRGARAPKIGAAWPALQGELPASAANGVASLAREVALSLFRTLVEDAP